MTLKWKLISTLVILLIVAGLGVAFGSKYGNGKIPVFLLAIPAIAFMSLWWGIKTVKSEPKKKAVIESRKIDYENIIAYSFSAILLILLIAVLINRFV